MEWIDSLVRIKNFVAALLVKVDKMLRKELHLEMNPSVFWADRQTVLKYIRNVYT